MFLFIWSILAGAVCFTLGISSKSEILGLFLGIVGFISPSLFVLDKIYKEVKKSQNNIQHL
jgi:hypothetical protein